MLTPGGITDPPSGGAAAPVAVLLNLLLLLVVSFLPFPTWLLAESVDDADAGKVATTFYGVTLLVASALMGILWRYALAHRWCVRRPGTTSSRCCRGSSPLDSGSMP